VAVASVFFWALFGAGLLLQAFGPHLKIKDNRFVLPPSLVSACTEIRPLRLSHESDEYSCCVAVGRSDFRRCCRFGSLLWQGPLWDALGQTRPCGRNHMASTMSRTVE
jgi:hypothetical protein